MPAEDANEDTLTSEIRALWTGQQRTTQVRQLLPRLRRILTTQIAVDRFFSELASAILPSSMSTAKAA